MITELHNGIPTTSLIIHIYYIYIYIYSKYCIYQEYATHFPPVIPELHNDLAQKTAPDEPELISGEEGKTSLLTRLAR